jgi:hypothetical protein
MKILNAEQLLAMLQKQSLLLQTQRAQRMPLNSDAAQGLLQWKLRHL